ncbi:MAG: hypothetical protein ACE5E6_12610 [Phycisphaerae bacterium]
MDYRPGAVPERYGETFDDGAYCVDDSGGVDIVLRRVQPVPDDRFEPIDQVVHVHGVWRSIPGRTIADDTLVNATVTYMILAGGSGATFEGAGSLFYRENRRRDALTGTLEGATLVPVRRVAGGGFIFHQAALRGRFHAVRDCRRTHKILHDLERTFGPRPPYRIPES